MDWLAELSKGAVKLDRLLIEEVSGPANEVPGWLVAKSHTQASPDRTYRVTFGETTLTLSERGVIDLAKAVGPERAGELLAAVAVLAPAPSSGPLPWEHRGASLLE